MKSRISFFDPTTCKKDITRFIPLWAMYTIFMLLTMFSIVSRSSAYSHPVRLINNSLGTLAETNLIYAVLVAQLLFGELFQRRLCDTLHAMPVTRTARFGSHVCAGLMFSFIPNLLTALLIMPSLGTFWYTALLWLGVVTLQYLFFCGVGVLSAMCTGSRVAMTIVYFLINFLALVVNWLIETIYVPLMPGVQFDYSVLAPLCPAFQFADNCDYFRVTFSNTGSYSSGIVTYPFEEFAGYGESWLYPLICAGVGIAALVLALLLYRRRQLESAGDFIAVKWLSPIFLVLFTLCSGSFLALFGFLFDTHIPSLIIGLVLGFFAAKMLLARTIRVFQKKSFLQLVAFAVAMLLSIWAVNMDLFGITSYVPDAEDVAYVTIDTYNAHYIKLSYSEHVDIVREIHQLAVEDPCDGSCGDGHTVFWVEYHLKDGGTVIRNYYLCKGSEAESLLAQLSFTHIDRK